MEWQKCPVCDGTGLVSKPPWVTGDQQTWTDDLVGPFQCPLCQGLKVILSPPEKKGE